MDDDPTSTPGGEAACFGHRLVDGHVVDCETARDVARFRKAERQRLYALRRALPVGDREAAGRAITDGLRRSLGPLDGRAVAVYWPIRGEPDLRSWMREIHDAGARVLLPAVEARNQPLVFRNWEPGCRMTRGHWDIPVPDDTDTGRPDLVVAPLLGVDADGYRLGNGGGYYDRTLVRIEPRPQIVGVGYAFSRIPTIFPMPWDVAMDLVVLDDGCCRRRQPV
ncbi:5-formyltetrahydrofolate cyclo-ligase [Thalassobaculum sp. OXR-137]|uniref:5-formyltetrahydrofolate cyclo-ligase n=1 Tax=Thalassobaculum sp. OXR-137 TaxID=3100173 RepID=UPI002AC9E744|nr:5-formyltetrahydrofolate cyclo-ligase [Thalassobaculum sp. OXR-137]WPZ35005.1 5-formyltetrahydrofolate cyclo-ligase [Thalassobaculum sp. OXR-137]